MIIRGYDTVRTSDVGLGGELDSSLIRWSQGKGVIILTLDEDFIRLRRAAKKQFSVIVIRTHPPTPDKIKELLDQLFSKVNMEEHVTDLIIVTDREVKIESR